MIRTSLLALLVISIVCTWCGKDFVSLGRHTWRCRSKINPEDINNNRSSSNKTLEKTTTQPVIQVNEIQCSCGEKMQRPSRLDSPTEELQGYSRIKCRFT